MRKTELQNNVLEALSDGGMHTAFELNQRFHTTGTGSAISRLAFLGYPIKSQWASEDGRRFKYYWLEKDNNGKEQQQ